MVDKLKEFIRAVPEEFTVEGVGLDCEWGCVPIESTDDLPKIQGIYMVIEDDDILYVGKSINIHQRWKNGHHKQRKFYGHQEAAIIWVELPVTDRGSLTTLERYYIQKHTPQYQGQP